jgi:hypothetical protein
MWRQQRGCYGNHRARQSPGTKRHCDLRHEYDYRSDRLHRLAQSHRQSDGQPHTHSDTNTDTYSDTDTNPDAYRQPDIDGGTRARDHRRWSAETGPDLGTQIFGSKKGVFLYTPDAKFQSVAKASGEVAGRCS